MDQTPPGGSRDAAELIWSAEALPASRPAQFQTSFAFTPEASPGRQPPVEQLPGRIRLINEFRAGEFWGHSVLVSRISPTTKEGFKPIVPVG